MISKNKNFLSFLSGKNESYLFLFFIAVALIVRLFSFWYSVLDHDESTYLIIGRDILHGKRLYTDVTDTKPVGIFLFYAGLEFLFGSSIFYKRLVFAIVVGITGYFIFRASKKMFNQNRVAVASGLIYIFYTSIWNYHGRSPNTELLFNLFTIVGLLFFLRKNYLSYFFGGLVIGIGFIIKYLVLFDLAAFLFFFFMIEAVRNRKFFNWPVIFRSFLAGFAFLIPFGLVNLHFWLGDHFKDFYYITYKLPENYGSNPSILRYLVMLLDFTAKFLPISYLVFYVIFKKSKPFLKDYGWFFLLWIVAVLFAMYLPGKEFSHYTIQLMLPFSLLAGLFFHPEFVPDKISSRVYAQKPGLIFLVVLLLVIETISFRNEILKKDYPREVAEYISDNMDKNDKVYVSNYEQIIYYLLNLESPTRFVHSNLLFTNTFKAFQIKPEDEITRIIKTNPEYVLVNGKNSLIEKLIKSRYHLVKRFKNNQIQVYKSGS